VTCRAGEVLTGAAGSATQVVYEPSPGDRPDWLATVSMWLLDCPGQSPAWHDYRLSIVHLRPITGTKPAAKRYSSSTHEVVLCALDSDKHPVPDDPATWELLSPLNVCEQIELPDDEAARSLLRSAAQAVVAGLLPAEPWMSGAVEPWRTSLLKTAAHYRGEAHAP
jgi:hypothetical protein